MARVSALPFRCRCPRRLPHHPHGSLGSCDCRTGLGRRRGKGKEQEHRPHVRRARLSKCCSLVRNGASSAPHCRYWARAKRLARLGTSLPMIAPARSGGPLQAASGSGRRKLTQPKRTGSQGVGKTLRIKRREAPGPLVACSPEGPAADCGRAFLSSVRNRSRRPCCRRQSALAPGAHESGRRGAKPSASGPPSTLTCVIEPAQRRSHVLAKVRNIRFTFVGLNTRYERLGE